MGRRFGKEWDLAVSTPAEALQLIEANSTGFGAWVRTKQAQYASYRVTVTDKNGKKMTLNDATFGLNRSRPAVIRFTPITKGASAVARMVVGAALMISAIWLGPPAFWAGASMFVGGLIEVLSPTPKVDEGSASDDGTSYYFNGPVNTSAQGIPVPLIYGRCLVGSQAVSAHIAIEQLMG
jgi:predicted phage tail protein